MHTPVTRNSSQRTLGSFIFLSRWLQAPLYLGLIVAQGVYVYRFVLELWHLLHDASTLAETQIMLSVLALIDVVMIANLLIMVIIGGYETFVSRLNVEQHSDRMVFWQVMIHVAFVASAVFLAWIERIVTPPPRAHA